MSGTATETRRRRHPCFRERTDVGAYRAGDVSAPAGADSRAGEYSLRRPQRHVVDRRQHFSQARRQRRLRADHPFSGEEAADTHRYQRRLSRDYRSRGAAARHGPVGFRCSGDLSDTVPDLLNRRRRARSRAVPRLQPLDGRGLRQRKRALEVGGDSAAALD